MDFFCWKISQATTNNEYSLRKAHFIRECVKLCRQSGTKLCSLTCYVVKWDMSELTERKKINLWINKDISEKNIVKYKILIKTKERNFFNALLLFLINAFRSWNREQFDELFYLFFFHHTKFKLVFQSQKVIFYFSACKKSIFYHFFKSLYRASNNPKKSNNPRQRVLFTYVQLSLALILTLHFWWNFFFNTEKSFKRPLALVSKDEINHLKNGLANFYFVTKLILSN